MENVSSLLQCLVFFQNYKQGFKASEGDFMMPYITAIDFGLMNSKFDELKEFHQVRIEKKCAKCKIEHKESKA